MNNGKKNNINNNLVLIQSSLKNSSFFSSKHINRKTALALIYILTLILVGGKPEGELKKSSHHTSLKVAIIYKDGQMSRENSQKSCFS